MKYELVGWKLLSTSFDNGQLRVSGELSMGALVRAVKEIGLGTEEKGWLKEGTVSNSILITTRPASARCSGQCGPDYPARRL